MVLAYTLTTSTVALTSWTKLRTLVKRLTFTDLTVTFTREAADHVVARVKKVRKKIQRPFLLENPSYYILPPGADMEETDFYNAVLEEADCGLLLDVNNVYVNSRNHGFDPQDFIRRLPLERVGQIHLAGHRDCGDVVVDTHEGPIIDPVWALYRFTLEALGRPVSTLIEWDTDVPPLPRVTAEADKARGILFGAGWNSPSPSLSTSVDSNPTRGSVKRRTLADRREAALR
jgi:uncharacterized protein (UPF0276 family)